MGEMLFVYEPREPPSCGVHRFPRSVAPGTVLWCTGCGETWVAYSRPVEVDGEAQVGVMWRPERRWARRRRERRCAHDWKPADEMIRWHCVKCGKDRDGMPK